MTEGIEIRTKKHNLLLGKIVMNEEKQVYLEVKNGKRVDYISLVCLMEQVNSSIENGMQKIQLVY